jgi:hypothetical protein
MLPKRLTGNRVRALTTCDENDHEMSWSSHEVRKQAFVVAHKHKDYDFELTMMDPELHAVLLDTRMPPSVPVRESDLHLQVAFKFLI